jgi:hypothetical protein
MSLGKLAGLFPLAAFGAVLGTSFENLDETGLLVKLSLLAFALVFGSILAKPITWLYSASLLGLAVTSIVYFDIPYGVWLAKTSSLVDIAPLLLCVSLLSLVFKEDPWIKSFGEMLNSPGKWAPYSKAVFSTMLVAPILNMGSIAVMSVALSRGELRQAHYARAVASGAATAMLWSPTFAPIALVMGFFPSIRWTGTLWVTLPVAALGLLIHGLVFAERDQRERTVCKRDSKSRSPYLPSIWLILFIALLTGLLTFSKVSSTQAISLAAASLVFFLLWFRGRSGSGHHCAAF